MAKIQMTMDDVLDLLIKGIKEGKNEVVIEIIDKDLRRNIRELEATYEELQEAKDKMDHMKGTVGS